MKLSVVIPNFNGKSILEKALPLNAEVLNPFEHEIIIVDDCSTDDSVSFLKDQYPFIKVIENKKNLGFTQTSNKGVFSANFDTVLLLNSDMIIHSLDLMTIQRYLDDPTIFAVTPHVYRTNKPERNESLTMGYFKGGWLHTENTHLAGLEANETEGTPILWACGGAMFFLKKRFQALDGFDPLFYPFYFEDTDLSYRAWKRGWKSIYTQTTTIEHFHQSTIGSHFDRRYIDRIHLRNEYLFTWKNLNDSIYVIQHILCLLLRILTFQVTHLKAMGSALLKSPQIIRYRKNAVTKVSDRQILTQWNPEKFS